MAFSSAFCCPKVSVEKQDKQKLQTVQTKYYFISPFVTIYQFIYLGGNISSTESDVNIHVVKAWTAIDKLMTLLKSNLR